MSHEIIKTIEKPDGSERLQIVRRQNGTYSFIVDRRDTNLDGQPCWSPVGFGGIYETAEIAEREGSLSR